MTAPHDAPAAPAADHKPPQLRRSRQSRVIGGVCGGLGRYCDIDPVIFRIVLGVLTVTGGIGLIFYGFAWLLIPAEDDDENEARRLLSGRVEGPALAAVLMALAGCGLFLSMLNNGSLLAFAMLLSLAVAGSAVWSQRRRLTAPESPLDPVTAQAVADAPPETKAPPAPGTPSWWRDPIVKDGSTGPVPSGYLWGPAGTVVDTMWTDTRPPVGYVREPAATRGPRSIGGLVLLLALIAGGLGTGLSWASLPIATSLQIGLASALLVFAVGLVVSSFLGRTGFGTIMMACLTAVLLAGAAALPKSITSEWTRSTWTPASVATVQHRYELGSGVGTLDLGGLAVPAGRTLTTGAEVGAGRIKVVVPKDVTVKIDAEVGLGDIQLPGEGKHDVDVAPGRKTVRTLPPPAGAKPAGTIELRLQVGLGQAEVTRAAS
ncbi:PspC domain-containing protein [Streptomyces sannanensis]|uniref:PspC domain-containing protein n=1 Tax=Streptomyces sannanensis TaxID=285536 RepID=A0ABP6SE31_9ACTN